MATSIYIPRENGDLKFVAEVEDEDRPDFALDAVLDEDSLKRVTRNIDMFIALVGDDGTGQFVTVELDGDEPIERPKRNIRVSGVASVGEATVSEEPVEAPTPAKRTAKRKTGGRTEVTDELIDQAIEMHNEQGIAMAQIAKQLGVSSPGYLARVIRERRGSDSLVKPGVTPAKKTTAKRGGRKASPFKAKADDD